MIPLESATAILPKMSSSRALTGDFHLTLDANSKATGSPLITSSPVYRLLRSRNQRRNSSASSVRSSCCSRAECKMFVPKRVEVCQLEGTASQGKDEESVALQLAPNNCPRIFSESNKSSQDKSTPNNGVSISQERNASTLEESPGEKQTNKQTTTMQKPMKPNELSKENLLFPQWVTLYLKVWLNKNDFQDDIDNTGLISAIKTDHAAIVLQISSVEKQPTGPSYWKFNSSLLEVPEYINLIKDNVPSWLAELVTGQVARESCCPKSCCPKPEWCCPKFIVMPPEILSSV